MKRSRTSAVIDTNVVISSLWGGYPRKVIDMWQAGRMTLITTLDILSEYMDVIRRFNTDTEIEEEVLLFYNYRRASLGGAGAVHGLLR